MAREIRPGYPELKGEDLEAARAKAREGGLAGMSREERRAYGDAVEKAVKSLQHHELMTCRTRIDSTPAAVKYAAAMAAPRRLLLILPGVVDVELSPRHKDRTSAIAGNGEPMLLQIPAS